MSSLTDGSNASRGQVSELQAELIRYGLAAWTADYFSSPPDDVPHRHRKHGNGAHPR
jgi:hypothetical protein